jgi:hypothetical protein
MRAKRCSGGGRRFHLQVVDHADDAVDAPSLVLRIGLDLGVRDLSGERHDTVRDVDVDVHDVREAVGRELGLDRRVNGRVVDLTACGLGRRTPRDQDSQAQNCGDRQESSITMHGFL